MKAIQFVSLFGQDEVDATDVGLTFKNKEIKTVTDEQAAILLSNPNFKEARASEKPAPSSPAEGKE